MHFLGYLSKAFPGIMWSHKLLALNCILNIGHLTRLSLITAGSALLVLASRTTRWCPSIRLIMGHISPCMVNTATEVDQGITNHVVLFHDKQCSRTRLQWLKYPVKLELLMMLLCHSSMSVEWATRRQSHCNGLKVFKKKLETYRLEIIVLGIFFSGSGWTVRFYGHYTNGPSDLMGY